SSSASRRFAGCDRRGAPCLFGPRMPALARIPTSVPKQPIAIDGTAVVYGHPKVKPAAIRIHPGMLDGLCTPIREPVDEARHLASPFLSTSDLRVMAKDDEG